MPQPFFSVVIPTINRIEPLKITIESVLAQEFGDLECLVIDNNLDERLDGVCEPFQDDRLRRLKTGGLNMADNWDFAVQAARGDFIIIIEDKKCLYTHALLIARRIIQKTQAQLLLWGGDVLNDLDSDDMEASQPWGSRKLRTIASDEVLEEFTFQDGASAKSKPGYFPVTFAVGSISVIKKSLLDEIRDETGLKICLPVNPDFTIGCHLLNKVSTYLYFDGPMSFVHSLKTSTGGNWHKKRTDLNDFWKGYGGQEIGYRHVPIKCIFIESQPTNDYLAMTQLLGGRLARHPMNWTMYYVVMHEQNARNQRHGLDRDLEMRAWQEALDREPLKLRLRVRLLLLRLSLKRAMKTFRARSGLRRLELIFKGKPAQVNRETKRKFSGIREFLAAESARLREIDLGNPDFAEIEPPYVTTGRANL